MTPDQVIATVMALLAAEPAETSFPVITAGGAKVEYPVAIEPCPRPLPAAEVEGKSVICGRVDVPEDHDAPDGPRIQLSFAVLKAPTVPSILVETAFISNPDEEALLRDAVWQARLVDALADGIRRYFLRNPPLADRRRRTRT